MASARDNESEDTNITATVAITLRFIGLTRIRSATATGSERKSKWKCFYHGKRDHAAGSRSLHRLVRRIESREALYLGGFFGQVSIDFAPDELAVTEKQVACVAASGVSTVENQYNLSVIAVRKWAVWHVCVAKIGKCFPRNRHRCLLKCKAEAGNDG